MSDIVCLPSDTVRTLVQMAHSKSGKSASQTDAVQEARSCLNGDYQRYRVFSDFGHHANVESEVVIAGSTQEALEVSSIEDPILASEL